MTKTKTLSALKTMIIIILVYRIDKINGYEIKINKYKIGKYKYFAILEKITNIAI